MAFQVGTTCFSTSTLAAQAAAAGQVGQIVPLGSSLYAVDVSSVSGSSITYSFEPVGSGSAFTKVVPFTPPACALLDTADGVTMAWGVAVAWLAVYGLMFMRRALEQRGEES